MRFGRRGPAASWAALVAGRHLWVVLEEPGAVSLEGPLDGRAVPVHEERQGAHHGVRLDLADLPDGTFSVLLDGRPLRGPELAPAPAGGPTRLERDGAGRLVVHRSAPAPAATVRALRLVGGQVEVDLDLPAEAREVTVLRPLERRGATRDTVVVGPADLDGAAPGDHPVLVDGVPVRRRANGLADPGRGALLPAVHPTGAAEALARLRWSDEARLVVRVHR